MSQITDTELAETATPAVPETAAVPPAAEQPAPADGPWAADLRAAFGDDAEGYAKADAYMREKVQPRITQLEQSPAQRLYRDLTDPKQVDVTMAALTSQVYGEDIGEKFIALFGEEGAEAAAEVTAAGGTPDEAVAAAEAAKPAELTPEQEWARNKMEQEAKEEGEQEYDEFLDKVIAEPEFKLTPEDKALIHPFMANSDTVGEAVGKYHAYVEAFSKRHGVTPAEHEAADTGQAPPPPPTLGSQGAPAATPPTAKRYDTWDDIDDALVDYQAEQSAKRAAPPTL
jgi:hypothetical protein